MSGSMAGRSADADAEKGRVEATKVKRYRPGQVPEWMKTVEEEPIIPALVARPAATASAVEDAAMRRTGVAAPVIVKRADDPRLRRLAQHETRLGAHLGLF